MRDHPTSLEHMLGYAIPKNPLKSQSPVGTTDFLKYQVVVSCHVAKPVLANHLRFRTTINILIAHSYL